MTKLLCVYCASSDRLDPKYYAAATALGHEIVARGWGLVYGGGKTGMMGAVARAVKERGGRVVGEVEVDGLLLRHEADPAEPRPELSGHFHPKLRMTIRGKHVARRCFVASATKLILPAFGALTGGMDAGDPAIRAALAHRPAEALVPVAGRLLRFPITA